MSRRWVLVLFFSSIAGVVHAGYPTTGLQLHFDAGSLTGYSDGDTVAVWPDLAGGDNNGTSAGTPTYIANVLNGLPVIKIDGTSDRTGKDMPHSNDFYSIPTVYNVKTIAFVFKPTSNTYYSWAPMMAGPTNDNYGWHGDTHWGTAYWDYLYSINSIANSNLAIDGVGGYDGGLTGVDYDHFRVITIKLDSGTQFDLGFLAHTARYNDFNVYGMEIAELLVYDQSLNDADIEELQFELGHKYGLWSAKLEQPSGDAPVSADSDLVWQPYNASWAVDVYLDPNETAVSARAPHTRVVTKEVVSSYDPGTLDLDTTYHWRVDLWEPNSVGTGYILSPGPVWSFTTVPPDPSITTQPVSQTVDAGSAVDLSIDGDNLEGYQWYLNGVAISNANGPTYHINALSIAEEGVYTCVGSNSVGTATSDPAVVVSKRLMGWWKLDGDLTDSVALEVPGAIAHDGSISNPDFVGSGKDGGAYKFLQDPRVITIGDSADYFNFYPQGFTVSAWVNTAQTGWGGLVAKISGDDTTGFYVTHNGTWLVSGARGIGDIWYFSNVYNTWLLVTQTLDANTNTIREYVNGRMQGEATYSGNPPINREPLYFGAQSADGTVFPYVGLIDDVRIWSYPLDAVQAARLYTDLTPGSEVCAAEAGFSVFDITGPAGAPDCRVDLFDVAAMAEQWLGCKLVPTCIN